MYELDGTERCGFIATWEWVRRVRAKPEYFMSSDRSAKNLILNKEVRDSVQRHLFRTIYLHNEWSIKDIAVLVVAVIRDMFKDVVNGARGRKCEKGEILGSTS